MLKPEVHRGNKNGCENHHNGKGCGKGNDGGGHDRMGFAFSDAFSNEGDAGWATKTRVLQRLEAFTPAGGCDGGKMRGSQLWNGRYNSLVF